MSEFRTLPITSIHVDRDARQRRELTGIEELAESIARSGLLNPIVIDENYKLIAGERRLTACLSLGWTDIPAHLLSDLDEHTQSVIELEENIRRVDLSWQDRAAAIAKYHTAAGGSLADTAASLGLATATVGDNIAVAESLANPRIAEADKFSVALGIVRRERERRATSQLASLILPVLEETEEGEVVAVAAEAEPQPLPPLINADFTEWVRDWTGPKFNMIHCDFPYGVNMQSSEQGAGGGFGIYEDTPDIYFSLLHFLCERQDDFIAQSAHMIFWFSMDYYDQTRSVLQAAGWTVSPFPLIWFKTDNTGILPDAKRQPRRVYETAFFCSRGDRLLATGLHGQGPVANAFGAPGRGKTLHMNEKPVEMLRHFMRLCVDEFSLVLDPTCGSGNALKAAQSLGAHDVLGIERDEEFYTRAVEAFYAPAL